MDALDLCVIMQTERRGIPLRLLETSILSQYDVVASILWQMGDGDRMNEG